VVELTDPTISTVRDGNPDGAAVVQLWLPLTLLRPDSTE